MEHSSILNHEQSVILKEVSKNNFLQSHFYFTGGTALSEIYLKHRESVDLDFFSSQPFDAQTLFTIISAWATQYHFTIQTRYIEPTHIYQFEFPNKQRLKVDFGYYPYQQLQKPAMTHDHIWVDSLDDIAVNKLLTTTQRVEVKDFVDLYFLLEKFTFWDLREGVRQKFKVEIEPLVMATDLLAVEDFTFLPRMIKPLTLSDLQHFFREQARSLSKHATV